MTEPFSVVVRAGGVFEHPASPITAISVISSSLVAVNGDIGYVAAMARDVKHSETKLIRMSPELLARIMEWRRALPDLPSEAEAIRRLIEAGLRAESSAQSLPKEEKPL